jgi:hypothetical protein
MLLILPVLVLPTAQTADDDSFKTCDIFTTRCWAKHNSKHDRMWTERALPAFRINSPKIGLKNFEKENRMIRGLYAKAQVHKGEILATIPATSILTAQTVLASPLLALAQSTLLREPCFQWVNRTYPRSGYCMRMQYMLTAVFLLRELAQRKSPWVPYLMHSFLKVLPYCQHKGPTLLGAGPNTCHTAHSCTPTTRRCVGSEYSLIRR